MKDQRFSMSLRPLATALLLCAGLALTGCASGGMTSIGLPPDSPWDTFGTILNSPHGDLIVTTTPGVSAVLTPQGQAAVCTSDQGGFFAFCSSPDCNPPGPLEECIAQAPVGATNVGFGGKLPFGYQLQITLDRSTFTVGGLQFRSATAGVVGAIGISLAGTSNLNLSASFSENLIPGPTPFEGDGANPLETAAVFDDFAGLLMSPGWSSFGTGFLCTDGSTTSCDPSESPDGVLAVCDHDEDGTADQVVFRTNVLPPPNTTLQCGGVTVNFGANPPFTSQGDCLTTLMFQNCFNIADPHARNDCIRVQSFVCRSLFK